MAQLIQLIAKFMAQNMNIAYKLAVGTDVASAPDKFDSILKPITLLNINEVISFLRSMDSTNQASFLSVFSSNLSLDDATLNAKVSASVDSVCDGFLVLQDLVKLRKSQDQLKGRITEYIGTLNQGK